MVFAKVIINSSPSLQFHWEDLTQVEMFLSLTQGMPGCGKILVSVTGAMASWKWQLLQHCPKNGSYDWGLGPASTNLFVAQPC